MLIQYYKYKINYKIKERKFERISKAMLTDISNIKTKTESTQQNEPQLKGYFNKSFQTMKVQVRALKRENQLLKSHHQQEIVQYKQEVANLKKKIANLSQKEIIKLLMNADDQQQTKLQIKRLQTKNQQNTGTLEALRLQNQSLKQKLNQYEQTNRNLKSTIQNIMYQKQKHLQISIMQKIQLEEKNNVLQSDIKSKANIIVNLKNQIQRNTKNQVQLAHQQRKLKKKIEDINAYQKQLKEVNRFNQQKVQAKLSKVTKQNQFLKNHIKKLQKNYVVQCKCSIQMENFKNKYINKSRQLSKTKMELSKELFKENMNAKLRKNLNSQHDLQQRDQDQILFRLTQNSDSDQRQREYKVEKNYKNSSKISRS